MMRFNKNVIVGLLIVAALVGWWTATRPIQLTEEVRLANGTVIDIERTLKMTPLGEIGGAGGQTWVSNSLKIVKPALDAPAEPWHGAKDVAPILLDRDPANGEWFVVATFITCEAWRNHGMPGPPYVEFRWRDSKWVQTSLSPYFIGRKANLRSGIRASGEPARVPLAAKEHEMSDPTIYKVFSKIIARSDDDHCR